MTRLWKNQALTIARADDRKCAGADPGVFFEYRKPGIAEVTNNAYGAHVIRRAQGMESPALWRNHGRDLQMVYVTQGRMVFECGGDGTHVLRAGSCALRSPGGQHREGYHSDARELLEIVSPTHFETRDEVAP